MIENNMSDARTASQSGAKSEDWKKYVEDFRRAGHQTVDRIAAYLEEVSELPVLAQTEPGELLDALPASAPEKGESFDAILRESRFRRRAASEGPFQAPASAFQQRERLAFGE